MELDKKNLMPSFQSAAKYGEKAADISLVILNQGNYSMVKPASRGLNNGFQ